MATPAIDEYAPYKHLRGLPQAPVSEPDFLNVKKGLGSWLVTLDHKRIGMMYLTGILIALIVGGAFALLVRTELFLPGKQLVAGDTYNQFFTLHGAVMVFLVIIPGIPAALGNIIMPIQLGAPDVAFPRLNLASFYLWVSGALLLVLTIPFGSLDTGWTLYTPYSLESKTPVLIAVSGVFLLGFSSIFTGLNFLVTIHKFRPQGMGWFQLPLNVWAIYSTAIMQVLATPVLGITVLLLAVERFAHIGIFDPTLGGDPVLFQHFFWFYSHPAVYIMIIPGMGVISELISVFSRKPLFGYRFVAYSSVSLALLSFLVWGHHMFVSGQSRLANMVFSALTFTVGIPSAIKVFNWVATLYKGDIRLKTPMLYALGFLLLFTIGGLTGLFLGILSVDVHLHDTYFVVAHFHYVMMGSTIVAFLGALHYWWPKFTGRMYNEGLGQICSLGVFFGFNLTFLPQFVMGSRGMPRRYWDYDPHYEIFHQLSTIGAFVLGISIFITVVSLVSSLKTGKKAPRNPWGGSSLEWQCPTPPTLYNFEKPPVLHELYNYDDLVEVEQDVWERLTPNEVEPAKADAIAKKIGAAADHTAGATETDRKIAQAHARAEESKSEAKFAESTRGAEIGKTVEEKKIETAAKGEAVAAADAAAKVEAKLEKEAEKAAAEAKKEEAKAEVKAEAKAEAAPEKPVEEKKSLTQGWDIPEVPEDDKEKK
ncbi:MAG TPA: cytochrome c oxidase subunit I [Kofleriaceae bacterium]|nr:cytochrome c oxidase subunit I [Kofleriaceae bacterium]